MRKGIFLIAMLAIFQMAASAADVKPVFSVQDGYLQAKWANQELKLSLDCPSFIFKGAAEVQSEPVKTDMAGLSEGRLVKIIYPVVDLEDGGQLQVTGCWQWYPNENVLRQWARYQVDMPKVRVASNFSEAPGEPVGKSVETTITLMDITLNSIPSAGMLHIPLAPQSIPAMGNGLFAGIEYPVANARIEGDSFILAQRPGKVLIPGKQYETHKVVYGFTPVGDELRDFQAYIMSNRPNLPSGMHISYCSWWSAPRTYAEEDMLKLMRAFNTDLFKPYGNTFDSFTIDMGWSDVNSIWGISKERFPQGFDNLNKSLDDIKSHLGLWLSPSSCYPYALDNAWAAAQGYETYTIKWTGFERLYACMGGPKYAKAYKDTMVTMVNERGVRYFKIDGFYLDCPSAEHGHEPGVYSSEVVVENALAAFDACRVKYPSVWIALYNMGNNASPWWLSHLSTVQGCWGDESPVGRVPSPVLRENYTSSRDYFNLQGMAWSTMPAAGQDIIGLVHQSDGPFLNDGVMVAGRGNTFYAAYINPNCMNERRWAQLDGLFKWLRANGEVLSQTETIFPASWQGGKVPKFEYETLFPREPYGYTHWVGNRGLVMLRNPWVSKQVVHLDLSKQPRVTPGLAGKPWSIVSLYPEVRGYGRDLTEKSVVDIHLAPYETLVLSIAADHNLDGVKPYSDFIDNCLKVSDVKESCKKVVFEEMSETAGPDWTALPDKSVKNTYELNLSGKIENSQGQAELLVLFENPRQKEPSPVPFDGKLIVNGKEVPLTSVFSDSLWKSTGQPSVESWTYMRGKLEAGKNDFSLQITSPTGDTKVSCWAWTYKSGDGIKTNYPNALPSPESIYLDSALVLSETTDANAVGEPELRKRKVEKINGVYLDTLKAVSSTQSVVANQSIVNKPLVIAGQPYERGIGTLSNALILYDIEGKGFKRFTASVGVDIFGLWVSSMDFSVWVDGVKRWDSDGIMKLATPAMEVNVDISGAKQLELRVGDGGDGTEWDLADFGNAKLLND